MTSFTCGEAGFVPVLGSFYDVKAELFHGFTRIRVVQGAVGAWGDYL